MFKTALISFIDNSKDNLFEQTFYGSLITLLIYMHGLISTPIFWVLVIFMIIDFLIGIYSAFVNKIIDGDKLIEGAVKKCYVGILIILASLIDFVLSYFGINTQGIFHNFIMATLLARELGSIIRNAEMANLWVPSLFKTAMKSIKNASSSNKGSE